MSTTISSAPAPTRQFKPREGLDERGDPSRLLRYAANIPLVGGVIETIYGIEEIKHAKTQNARVNGDVDAVRGIGSSIDDLASIPLYGKMVMAVPAGLLKVAAPVAGAAGCLTAVLDGGRDIYNGIQDHDKSEEVVGGIKIAAGGISAAGAFTANPVLMVAGTVVYTGAVLYQNRKSIENIYHTVEQKVEKWVDQLEQTCPPPRTQPA